MMARDHRGRLVRESCLYICDDCGHRFNAPPPLFLPNLACHKQGCAGLGINQTPCVQGLKRIIPNDEDEE